MRRAATNTSSPVASARIRSAAASAARPEWPAIASAGNRTGVAEESEIPRRSSRREIAESLPRISEAGCRSSSGAKTSRSGSRSARMRSWKPAISSSTESGSKITGTASTAWSSQLAGIGETAGANTIRSASDGGLPIRCARSPRSASDSSEAAKGGSQTSSSRSVERCVSGSNSLRDSTRSPSSSTRTARSRSGGNTSNSPPRTERSPVSITRSPRR